MISKYQLNFPVFPAVNVQLQGLASSSALAVLKSPSCSVQKSGLRQLLSQQQPCNTPAHYSSHLHGDNVEIMEKPSQISRTWTSAVGLAKVQKNKRQMLPHCRSLSAAVSTHKLAHIVPVSRIDDFVTSTFPAAWTELVQKKTDILCIKELALHFFALWWFTTQET